VFESYPFLKDDNGNALDLDGNPRVVGGVRPDAPLSSAQ